MRHLRLSLLIAAWIVTAGIAVADDYLALGDQAFRDGKYAQAARNYALAVNGDGRGWAELNLALLYAKGLGVRPDMTIALKWLNYAATHVETATAAASLRDQLSQPGTGASGPITAVKPLPAAQPDPSASSDSPAPVALGIPIAPQSEMDASLGIVGRGRDEATTTSVPLKDDQGSFRVPVQINGAITLDFVLDTGADSVVIPEDVLMTLVRAGTVQQADLGAQQPVVLADGSTSPSLPVKLRSLKVGDFELHDIDARITNQSGELLLGETFLHRFKSWSINNETGELTLELAPTVSQ